MIDGVQKIISVIRKEYGKSVMNIYYSIKNKKATYHLLPLTQESDIFIDIHKTTNIDVVYICTLYSPFNLGNWINLEKEIVKYVLMDKDYR